MASLLRATATMIDSAFPLGSPRRKIVQLTSIVLVVEGLSVIILFTYVHLLLGVASLMIGAVLVMVFFRGESEKPPVADTSLGLRLVSTFERVVGGEYGLMVIGFTLVILVVLFNLFVSERPSYGDVDIICLMFGGLLLVFPVVPRQWYVEATFALVFLGCIVLFLAVPQALMSVDTWGTSSAGNWYVYYMLAAPLSAILDTIGVPSYSSGNLVTLQFQDGSVHTLAISAYCAGLYSFSIFLSAFISYTLVLERLRNSVLVVVLCLGIFVSYLGNLLRMVVVGVVGYYRGIDALHWTHENAGWVIFATWSFLFWWMILARVNPERADSPDCNEWV